MKLTFNKTNFDIPQWKIGVTGVVSLIAALMIMYMPGTANSQFLYYFAAAILGHFVGDYTFQNQWMAVGKSQPGMIGHISCGIRCSCLRSLFLIGSSTVGASPRTS